MPERRPAAAGAGLASRPAIIVVRGGTRLGRIPSADQANRLSKSAIASGPSRFSKGRKRRVAFSGRKRKPPVRFQQQAERIPTLLDWSGDLRRLYTSYAFTKKRVYRPNRPLFPNALNVPVLGVNGMSGTAGAICSRGMMGPLGEKGSMGAGVRPAGGELSFERGAGRVRIVPDCRPPCGDVN
jgi:hypothetical protein